MGKPQMIIILLTGLCIGIAIFFHILWPSSTFQNIHYTPPRNIYEATK